MKHVNKPAFSFCVAVLFVIAGFLQSWNAGSYTGTMHPRPLEDEEKEHMKEGYLKLIHRAAPGVDWRQVEEQNSLHAYFSRALHAGKTTSSFGGGVVSGVWHERGNTNLAGRIDNFAFLPATSMLYAVSDGGSVWKTPLPAVSWTKVSDVAQFRGNVVGIIPRTGGGQRLFVSSGLKVWYTDNDGTSFDTSSGINFPVAWGGNYVYQIIPVNDAAHTIYCATYEWDDVSWNAAFNLYSSTDSGVTFTSVRKFPYHNDNQLSFCSPLASGVLYALGVSSSAADTLFTINNSVVTAATATTDFAVTDNLVTMKCMQTSSGVTHFYAITGGQYVYHSTNFGAFWQLKSTLTSDNGYVLGLSSTNPNDVMYGTVEAHRSTDSGTTWALVNPWGNYYGAPNTNLHADIRNFSYFRYASGAEFGVTGTDGGAFITNDQLATVSNISLSGLNVNQLWDHITDPANTSIIFGGAQDQGLQSSAAGSGTGTITSTQNISGDYGQLRISGGGDVIWPLYPGGTFYLYNNLSSPAYLGSWGMTGAYKPNYGWMLPTSNYYTTATQNVILVGGGNISGGAGSYLIRLTMSSGGGFSVTPYQYAYDFYANSNTGAAGIASIAVSPLSNSLLYVGGEDGTFFYSTDAGTTWARTAGFTGVAGMWLYGSCILPSCDSVNKVYFAGSGYSNPPVYVSRDHGVTFTDMSNGLPPTLVNQLASFNHDSILFAATEAGPYVYLASSNMWYSLADATTPVVNWRSVEYLQSINTVRFGTYGRGIWDLVLTSPSTTGLTNMTMAGTDITVAPNPLKAGTPLKLISAQTMEGEFTVFDLRGNMVYNGKVTTNMPVILPGLLPGLYTYRINTATGMKVGTMATVD